MLSGSGVGGRSLSLRRVAGAYARWTGKLGAVLMTDRAAPGAPLHWGGAGAEGQRLRPALGPRAAGAKSNAIAARPKLPAMLTLRG